MGNTTEAVADDQDPIDLNNLTKDGVYFHYLGSDAQLEMLHWYLFNRTEDIGNWRSTMPINNRPLDVKVCERGEPPLKADNYTGVISGSNPLTEHEFRADVYMKKALRFANQARNHMKELDERLHKA